MRGIILSQVAGGKFRARPRAHFSAGNARLGNTHPQRGSRDRARVSARSLPPFPLPPRPPALPSFRSSRRHSLALALSLALCSFVLRYGTWTSAFPKSLRALFSVNSRRSNRRKLEARRELKRPPQPRRRRRDVNFRVSRWLFRLSALTGIKTADTDSGCSLFAAFARRDADISARDLLSALSSLRLIDNDDGRDRALRKRQRRKYGSTAWNSPRVLEYEENARERERIPRAVVDPGDN